MSPERLVPLSEACERLGGVSRSTIYREAKDNKILLTKVRGSTCVRESELVRYMRDHDRPRRGRKAA